jgi:glutathione peroxidase
MPKLFTNKIFTKLFITTIVVIALVTVTIQKNMTFRQSLLKTLYPVIMFFGKIFPSNHAMLVNDKFIQPSVAFYQLKAIANNGDTVNLEQFKGKKVLIVNTASDCGYTGQYDELEKLHMQYKDKLVVLGFPANDFKEQEKKKDDEIASFCKLNYGVSFRLMKKSQVIKGTGQNEVFEWLSDSTKNGWCNQQPLWNFSKYLINEDGVLTNFFSQTISPLDKKVIRALQ